MDTSTLLNSINLLLIVAVGQSVLLTILIFHKYSALYPNRFLGLLMLTLTLSLIHIYLDEQPFYNKLIIGSFLPYTIFLLGPLHFLYTKYLVHQPNRFQPIELLHFSPFLLFVLAVLTVKADMLHIDFEAYFFDGDKSGFIPINWVFALQVLVYYFLSIKQLAWYSKRIRDVFSSLESVRLQWLRLLTYLAMGVMVIFLLENTLNLYDMNITNFHLSSSLVALYVYGLGYFGISKTHIFQDAIMEEVTVDLPEEYPASESKPKYERSGLSSEQANSYKEQLLGLMEEDKVYTNSKLTLSQLADMLSISPHHLSEIINGHLNQSFFDLVNQYRVDQVISDLTNKDKKHLTMLAIGLDAGFNSKTTFNTIFKKTTGKTPSEYRKSLESISD